MNALLFYSDQISLWFGFIFMEILNLILIWQQDLLHTYLCEQGGETHINIFKSKPKVGRGQYLNIARYARIKPLYEKYPDYYNM